MNWRYVNKWTFEKYNLQSEININYNIPEDEDMFNDLSEFISSDEDEL